MKAPTEAGITRALQRGCAALAALIVLSAVFNLPVVPLPWNDGGRWRDELVRGWNEARDDDNPDHIDVDHSHDGDEVRWEVP